MKIKDVIDKAKKELIKHNIEDGPIIAKELLANVLEKNKQYLIINSEEELNEETCKKYKGLINKIITGTPLQYITHKQEFMGFNFYVDDNVLIPQPDTEILVEETDKISKNILSKKEKISILDLCTGSGAIAISLSKLLNNNAVIYASDISNQALKIAIKNNNQNNTNVEFVESDLFENIKEINNTAKFDIIVSNPPYIKTDIIQELSKQVQNEPKLALDGGIDGLEIYRRIISSAYKYINKNGFLCLEIGHDQKEEVLQLFAKYDNYINIKVIKDLSGNDRCIIGEVK